MIIRRGDSMDIVAIIDKWSKRLFVAIIIGLLLIFLFQGLMQNDDIRHFLVPVEKWEGERVPFA